MGVIDYSKPSPLKYKVAFTVNPEQIIAVARSLNFEKKKQQALQLLSALGVPDAGTMRMDILRGYCDVIIDEDGWLTYIDHRITKEVMQRMTEQTQEEK